MRVARTDEDEKLDDDVLAFGMGFARLRADGSWERLDPFDVFLSPPTNEVEPC